MHAFHPSRRFSRRAYRIMRWVVRLLTAGAITALCVAIYLNLYGVPGPVLRRVVQRINDAGFPVDIESIHLSLYGWQAENVRYYSRHPDDLKPLLHANRVYARSVDLKTGSGRKIHGYKLKAEGIECTPSVGWNLRFPQKSALTAIERAELSVGRTADRIVIRDGRLKANELEIRVSGTILGYDAIAGRREESIEAERLFSIEPQLYSKLDAELQALELIDTAVVEVDCMIDAAMPVSSRLLLTVHTGAVTYRDVAFSQAELEMTYDAPRFVLKHANVYKDNGMFGIKGEYDVSTREMKASISNSITSRRLFLLLPQQLLGLMAQYEIRSGSFPCFDIEAGPSVPRHLLQHISGSIAVRDASVKGLEFASLSGNLCRKGPRFDVVDVQAQVVGQEGRLAETGSSMRGGHAVGEFHLDTSAHTFGIDAEGEMDPNLLLEPLADVDIATNVISRFRFDEQPPKLRVRLGSSYDYWDDFFIEVQGSAEELRVHGVPLSSLSASSFYRDGVLSFNRAVAKQGVDFLNGTAAIDFRNGSADFDMTGSINPKSIEDVVYDRHGIFTHTIQVEGDTKLAGQGTVDWRHMRKTAFSVEVEAQRADLPMASVDDFSGTISGDGSMVKVEDAVFGIYGGTGEGLFSIVLDPRTSGIPYSVDVRIANADFNRCLRYLDSDASYMASGDLSGYLRATADITSGFFDSANGNGHVEIRNGQLADLPFFHGFSSLIRRMIPSFNVFSIDRLRGDFTLRDGVIHSSNAYFDGQLLSAKGRGRYSSRSGFDAYIQVQTFNEGNLSRFLRYFTDPILKLFEMKLEGTLKDPEWKLNPFDVNEVER